MPDALKPLQRSLCFIFFHGNFPGEEKSLDGAAYGNSMDDEFLMLSEKKCTHATWENVISTIEAVTANKT